jgi:hypothetical protein
VVSRSPYRVASTSPLGSWLQHDPVDQRSQGLGGLVTLVGAIQGQGPPLDLAPIEFGDLGVNVGHVARGLCQLGLDHLHLGLQALKRSMGGRL